MAQYRFSLILSILLFSTVVSAQSLSDQLDSIVNKSSNYQQYKVIKLTEINAFAKNLSDELSAHSEATLALNNDLAAAKTKIEELNDQISSLEAQLSESRGNADSISFLGIPMSKSSYHLIVWALIVLLVVLSAVTYMMFVRSNKLTQSTKKDYHALNREFDQFKDKSRESQVKLKRELQTAINTIEEMKKSGMRR